MNQYNIVLLPPDDVAQRAVAYAQSVLKPYSDGYCLEAGQVLPHITLAQCAHSDAHFMDSVGGALKGFCFKDTLFFIGLGVRNGTGRHEGFYWAEMVVEKTDPLLRLHVGVVEALQTLGVQPLNPFGEQYHPHLTFARISKKMELPECGIQEKSPLKGFLLAFGRSDQNGRYRGTLNTFS